MIDAIADIGSFTASMTFDGFVADKRTRLAVIRCLEVIGEAVKFLPEDLRLKHPEVEWRGAASMRDILIHAYFGSSDRIIWDTITRDLPVLERHVRGILEGLDPPP
jgi:uncharacterized protein with HEPN domain